jgi:hypothetical protein
MEFLNKLKSKLIYEDINRNQETLDKIESNGYCPKNDICDNIELTHKEECGGTNLMKDIEMFVDFTGNSENTVFSTFQTYMSGSRPLLQKLLDTPITNIDILNNRKQTIQRLTGVDAIPEKLARLKDLEKDVLWLFVEKDENLKDLFDIIYFKWLIVNRLNDSPGALTGSIFYKIVISPVIGILSPIVYFVIPYLVLRYKFGFKDISFITYLRISYGTLMSSDLFGLTNTSMLKWVNIASQLFSLLFYFQGVFNSVELSKTFYKISKHLTEKMNSVVEFVNIASELAKVMWNDDITNNFFNCNINIPVTFDFAPKPFSVLSHFGKQLRAFKKLDLANMRVLLQRTYVMDAIYSVVRYKSDMSATFAEYVVGDAAPAPSIKIEGVWHPCIPREKAVRNDVMVTNNDNAIITGPNAGGKSTFIKSLLVNTVFAQTIGVVLCSSLVMTPFHKIHSQINLPDNKGHESLFEAEMYRCKDVLDMLKSRPDRRTMIVMDEIFNSTNPVEGIAGAFAIVKKIAEYDNSLLVFTTHYSYLTKLQKATTRFSNYKMNIVKENNNIVYPYKLNKGVSKQYIALELLQLNGFDDDIIKEALIIKDKFVTKDK